MIQWKEEAQTSCPLCKGAVTSFVMLPCFQKVQLQIISQLWETPPGVNNTLSTPERGQAGMKHPCKGLQEGEEATGILHGVARVRRPLQG